MRQRGPTINFSVRASGCWEWEGQTGKRGYGTVSRKGQKRPAHRIVYELFKGSIPEGKEIHHSCGNKLCVNPKHLVAVTRKEHTELSPKMISHINGHKTHCAKGHELVFDQAFLRRTGRRRRYCRICRMEWQRKP